MQTDQELLRRYVENRDEAAFAEMVRRYVNLVYATALRLTNGRATLAEEASQAAFIDLARKASHLIRHPALAGWLHTSVRYTATKALRAENTRHLQEQAAAQMTDLNPSGPATEWAQIRPLLDEAIGQLKDREREALLLRFFQDQSYREVGEKLGLPENTARMRVERALEKLRTQFARRGVGATAALLASTLGAEAAPAAPAHLVTSITTQVLTATPPASPLFIHSVRALPMAAGLLLLVGLFAFYQSWKKNIPSPIGAQSTTVAQPTTGPATTPNQKNSVTKINLGAIDVLTAKTHTLEAGRIFSVEAERQADGTLHLVYGVFDADKFNAPDLAVSLASDDAGTTLPFNEYHSLKATPEVPIVLTLIDGETVSFTPSAKPWTVSQLGDVYLPDETAHTLTTPSGKLIELSHLSGRPLDLKFYASAVDYAAGKPPLSGTWVPAVGNHPVQEWLGDEELIVFTPHY